MLEGTKIALKVFFLIYVFRIFVIVEEEAGPQISLTNVYCKILLI